MFRREELRFDGAVDVLSFTAALEMCCGCHALLLSSETVWNEEIAVPLVRRQEHSVSFWKGEVGHVACNSPPLGADGGE